MNKQFIYVSLDLRRALWVPEATGAMVVCSYKSDLLPWMRERGADVWCFQEQFPEDKPPQSTSELLGNAKSLKWLRSLGKDLIFLVFKPANRIRQFIENEGWALISPDVDICRQLEDKVSFFELAQKYDVTIPKSEIVLWDETKRDEYHRSFGDPMIVQERMGHAGSCTHVVRKMSSHSWQGGGQRSASGGEQGVVAPGTRVKISEFITGPTYTFNGYVSPKGKLVISRLYQQLMDVPQWNEFEMGTVGISPELNLSKEVYEQLRALLLKMSPLFYEVKYSGFFGLDLIWNGKQWYLIECNPRFTASISLQCLTDVVNQQGSILRYHAEKTEPEDHEFRFLEEQAPFGHIVLRNSKKRVWNIPKTLKSGIYAKKTIAEEVLPLQGAGGREGQWYLRIRSYDAQDLEEGEMLLILAHEAGASIEPGSDFAGLQYMGSAYVDGKIDDRFFDFYDRVVMGHLIRTQDFLTDTYILLEGENGYSRPAYGDARPENGEDIHPRLQDELNVHPRIRDELNMHPRIQNGGWGGNGFPVYSKPSKTSQISTEILPGETIKLLGQYGDFFFIERADGTRGWLDSSIVHRPSTMVEFSLPNKQSTDSKSFFQYWQGKPYLLGGNSEQGIDCSAFVQRYFWEVKGTLLPKNSQDQKAFCKEEIPVGTRQGAFLQDDDLIFLHHKETKFSHVGIVRNNKIWHSGHEYGVSEQFLEEILEKYQLEGFCRVNQN